MLDRHTLASQAQQTEQLLGAMRTSVALDILRLPDGAEEEFRALRSDAIATLRKTLKAGE